MPKFISFALHVIVLLLLCIPAVVHDPAPPSIHDWIPQRPILLHIARAKVKENPGGGDRSPTPASLGRLPRFSRRQLVPPLAVPKPDAKVVLEPTLLSENDVLVNLASNLPIGDPLGVIGPPSLGSGLNGIGERGNGGYGKGDRYGVPTEQGAVELGGPTSDPVVVYKTEPEFSEQARKAKLQGTVQLEVRIGIDGRAHDIHVRRGLGLGLDEQAINAVALWRFRPAHRGGRPVAVPAVIEINFRLL